MSAMQADPQHTGKRTKKRKEEREKGRKGRRERGREERQKRKEEEKGGSKERWMEGRKGGRETKTRTKERQLASCVKRGSWQMSNRMEERKFWQLVE